MLRSLAERSYQAQSDLIIPEPLALPSLPSITQEIVGYFIIETHVLNTTGSFRSGREVEDLWDALISRLSTAVEDVLGDENEPDIYLKVKEALLGFVMTLEVHFALIGLSGSCLTNVFSRTLTLPPAYIHSFYAYSRSTCPY